MNQKQYRIEKTQIIKIMIRISMIITLFSIISNMFFFNGSGVFILIDFILLLVLGSLSLFYERIIGKKLYCVLIFGVFPLIYFPVGWLSGSGLEGVGVLYFFLFSIAIIYFNPNRYGLLASILLVVEIVGLILLEKNQIVVYGAVNPEMRSNLYLFHFPIAAVGYITIYYNAVRKQVDLTDKVYDTSLRDYLTNTFNRRYLVEHIEELIIKGLDDEEAFYLMFFDLDKFKEINDMYGHNKGDELLILFSECVNAIIRTGDIFGRYGGDEFILVVDKISYENAVRLGERIKLEFSEICRSKLGVDVGVSVGVVSGKGKTFDDIISLADDKMYKDKYREHEEVTFTE